MNGHGFVETVRIREYVFEARCECGHTSEGPNPDTARKRHDIHAAIQQARAALEGSRDGA